MLESVLPLSIHSSDPRALLCFDSLVRICDRLLATYIHEGGVAGDRSCLRRFAPLHPAESHNTAQRLACANFNRVAALGAATFVMAKLQKQSSFAWRGEADTFSLLNAIDHAAVRAFASGHVRKENVNTSSMRVYFLDGSYVACEYNSQSTVKSILNAVREQIGIRHAETFSLVEFRKGHPSRDLGHDKNTICIADLVANTSSSVHFVFMQLVYLPWAPFVVQEFLIEKSSCAVQLMYAEASFRFFSSVYMLVDSSAEDTAQRYTLYAYMMLTDDQCRHDGGRESIALDSVDLFGKRWPLILAHFKRCNMCALDRLWQAWQQALAEWADEKNNFQGSSQNTLCLWAKWKFTVSCKNLFRHAFGAFWSRATLTVKKESSGGELTVEVAEASADVYISHAGVDIFVSGAKWRHVALKNIQSWNRTASMSLKLLAPPRIFELTTRRFELKKYFASTLKHILNVYVAEVVARMSENGALASTGFEWEEDEVKALFDYFDADNSEYLDRDEVECLLVALGSTVNAQKTLHLMDDNGDNKVSFDEFQTWWKTSKYTIGDVDKLGTSSSEEEDSGVYVGAEFSIESLIRSATPEEVVTPTCAPKPLGGDASMRTAVDVTKVNALTYEQPQQVLDRDSEGFGPTKQVEPNRNLGGDALVRKAMEALKGDALTHEQPTPTVSQEMEGEETSGQTLQGRAELPEDTPRRGSPSSNVSLGEAGASAPLSTPQPDEIPTTSSPQLFATPSHDEDTAKRTAQKEREELQLGTQYQELMTKSRGTATFHQEQQGKVPELLERVQEAERQMREEQRAIQMQSDVLMKLQTELSAKFTTLSTQIEAQSPVHAVKQEQKDRVERLEQRNEALLNEINALRATSQLEKAAAADQLHLCKADHLKQTKSLSDQRDKEHASWAALEKKLSTDLAEKQLTIKRLMVEAEEYRMKWDALQSDMAHDRATLELMKENERSKDAQLALQNNELERLQRQSIAQQDELVAKSDQIAALNQALSGPQAKLSSDLLSAQAEVERMRDDLIASRRQHNESERDARLKQETLQSQCDAFAVVQQDMKDTIARLEKENEVLRVRVEMTQATSDKSEQRLSNTMEELKQRERELSESRFEVHTAMENNNRLQSALDTATASVHSLKADNQAANAWNTELRADNENFAKIVTALREELVEKETIHRTEIGTLQSVVTIENDELAELKQEVNDARHIHELQSVKLAMTTDQYRKTEEYWELEKKKTGDLETCLQTMRGRLDTSEQEHKELGRKLQCSMAENGQLLEQVKRLSKDDKTSKETMVAIKAELATSNTLVESLTAQLNDVKRTNLTLKQTAQSLQQTRNDEQQAHRLAIDKLHRQHEQTLKQLTARTAELRDHEERIAEMAQELEEAKQQHVDAHGTFKEQYAAVVDTLNQTYQSHASNMSEVHSNHAASQKSLEEELGAVKQKLTEAERLNKEYEESMGEVHDMLGMYEQAHHLNQHALAGVHAMHQEHPDVEKSNPIAPASIRINSRHASQLLVSTSPPPSFLE